MRAIGRERLENDRMPDAASPSANRFVDAQSVEELLGLLVGFGSTCWENLDQAGVFQADEASKGVHEAMRRYRELTGPVATVVHEWIVTGLERPGFKRHEETYSSADNRWDGDPEKAARAFIAAQDGWADGPKLERRTVTYGERVEA
jgi:hypothetical protein